jgi:hypothetical protein
MQECREQGRNSTRHIPALGTGRRGLCVGKTCISLSRLAYDQPARDISRALDRREFSPSIARTSRGHGGEHQDELSPQGSAATKLFQFFAARGLTRYAMSSMLLVAMVVVLADNGFGANLVGSLKGSLVAPGIFSPFARRAQMTVADGARTAYFLEQAPDDVQMSKLPKTAQDVVVARVQVLGVPAYLGGRDQSGRPSDGPRPKHALFARLKVIDVRRGDATAGAILDVKFGTRDAVGSLVHNPHTPDQLGRDYVVVMFRDNDGERSLAGFPISEAQYRQWETEVWDFERTRGRPGAPR